MAGIDASLLEILACPVPECRAALELRDGRLRCTSCGRRYPLTEQWPVLIPEEAEPPDKAGMSEKLD